MDKWSRGILTTAYDADISGLEEMENLVIGMQITRYLALASLTILMYDIVSTMSMESKYVWPSPWNFGRIIFHFNRFFAPALQILHLVCKLKFRVSDPRRRLNTLAALFRQNPTSQLPWVLVALLATGLGLSLPPLFFVMFGFKQDVHMRANPAPDVIPGCLFGGLAKWVWIPYVGSTLYETLLFGLTVYRVYMAEYELPIINRLYRDGTYYYVIVLAANLFTMIGTKFPLLSGCATGSGFLGSVMSVMCSRMLLSTKSFETKRHESSQERTMSETIRVPRSHRVKDATFWGIIEVNRTKLHIHVQDSEQGRGPGVQLQALPVMHIPGGPALRNGWARRDSEGEIVTRPT
ncbi:transmembrane protein [Ceratobasidium theobromae]|uniref:Transmembrane protein n=1 Tax=Ceratobasidium theobromae TaxID=1582974 RepID=A0A5N5QJB0_9AGAM|nr:transmembrane protein [Ceratobasidium theobromae]